MNEILVMNGEKNNVIVSVVADEDITIYTRFAGTDVWSNQRYDSVSKAISDARTLFHLLNGLDELMQQPYFGNRVTK